MARCGWVGFGRAGSDDIGHMPPFAACTHDACAHLDNAIYEKAAAALTHTSDAHQHQHHIRVFIKTPSTRTQHARVSLARSGLLTNCISIEVWWRCCTNWKLHRNCRLMWVVARERGVCGCVSVVNRVGLDGLDFECSDVRRAVFCPCFIATDDAAANVVSTDFLPGVGINCRFDRRTKYQITTPTNHTRSHVCVCVCVCPLS